MAVDHVMFLCIQYAQYKWHSPSDRFLHSNAACQAFQYDRLRCTIVKDMRSKRHNFIDLGDCSALMDRIIRRHDMKRGDDEELHEYQQVGADFMIRRVVIPSFLCVRRHQKKRLHQAEHSQQEVI